MPLPPAPLLPCSFLLALLFATTGCETVELSERELLPARPAVSPSAAVAEAAAAFGVAYEEHSVEAADGTALYAALLRQAGAEVTVLYFGGNEYTVEQFGLATARALLPFGVNLVLVDHRGYGWSGGEPTVDLLSSDALAVFDYVAALPEAGAVVVHGLSLGSFVAGHVGANRPAAGVVLENSATTPHEWAEARVPLLYKPFVRIRVEEALSAVDNRAAVAQITEPLLLLAGAEDEVTPPVLSQRLFEASPLSPRRKTFLLLEGAGHGDVKGHPAFAEAYRAFLDLARAPRLAL